MFAVSVGVVASYLAKYASGRLATFASRDMKQHLSEHIGELPVWSIEQRHSGDLVSRLNNDASEIVGFMENNFSNLVFMPLMALSAFVFMLFMNWRLLLVSFILTPVAMLITDVLRQKIGKYATENSKYLGEANSIVQDTISSMGVVKVFKLENSLYKKSKRAYENSMGAEIMVHKIFAPMLTVIIMMREFPRLLCFLFGGYLAINGELQLGSLVAFTQLLDYIIQPTTSLPYLIANITRTGAAIGRLSEMMDEPAERKSGGLSTRDNEDLAIEFSDVTFGYHKSEKVLEGLSFRLYTGEMVALVGPSGSGKSTIMDLICGFNEVEEGSIRLYGRDLRELRLSSIREQLAFVPQDVYIFPGTIAENIMYGRAGATVDEVIAAAKAANAHEFITQMPNGYDTLVGERGVKLSGGQQQQISIARAILKNAPILLLDEPTSALDTHSEALVQEALARLTEGRSVLVVAHRLSTIKQADNILVLDHGHIVEMGTHEQLIKENALYKQLYLRQIISQSSNSGEGA
jgi:ABC-type multidrug transport system fused ATPase/permease subunit